MSQKTKQEKSGALAPREMVEAILTMANELKNHRPDGAVVVAQDGFRIAILVDGFIFKDGIVTEKDSILDPLANLEIDLSEPEPNPVPG